MNTAEPTKLVTFKPKFTYPIFGDSEQIFGYQGLRIDLAFDCESLKPLLTYKYEEKLSDDIKKIEDTMDEFLPTGDYILKSESQWLDSIDEEKFSLSRENLIDTYEGEKGESKGKKYEIYKFEGLDKEDSVGRKLILRSQILSLLYIEAGSFIDLSDPRWSAYFIYERERDDSEKGTFVGFCTVYKYWNFQNSQVHDSTDVAELKYRGRISQVVILPPFQGMGHGRKMYEKVVSEWIRDEKCTEITVEDPNEEFDELRDRCDLTRLLELGHYKTLADAELLADEKVMEKTRKELKMTKRQFARVVEMALFWLLEHKGPQGQGQGGDGDLKISEKTIRLRVKRRVYEQNRDGLEGMDPSEVKSKLEEVYRRVKDGYLAEGGHVHGVFPGGLLETELIRKRKREIENCS